MKNCHKLSGFKQQFWSQRPEISVVAPKSRKIHFLLLPASVAAGIPWLLAESLQSDCSISISLSVCVCVCVRACVRACVRVCVCVCNLSLPLSFKGICKSLVPTWTIQDNHPISCKDIMCHLVTSAKTSFFQIR